MRFEKPDLGFGGEKIEVEGHRERTSQKIGGGRVKSLQGPREAGMVAFLI